MKKIIKELLFFFRDVICFLPSLYYCVFIQRFRNEIKHRNIQKPLFIVGNGPSATKGIEEIKNNRNKYHICTVNFSILTKDFFKIKPELHVFVDPYFFSHFNDDKLKRVLEEIKKIDWNISILVPFIKNNKFYEILKENKNIKPLRFCYSSWDTKSIFAKKIRLQLFEKNFITPKLQNVIVACIFNSIHLGYSDIKLYGVEHSWLNDIFVNEDNQVCLLDRHYYGNQSRPWKKNDTETFKMHEILSTLSYTFEAYWEIREFAQDKNVHIVNMTKNSFIDAFERGE